MMVLSCSCGCLVLCFFFSSRRRHTRCYRDWSSDVCSSDLPIRRAVDPLPEDWDLVVEEGKLDLELRLPPVGPLREDLEDEAEAVVAFVVPALLEVVVLGRVAPPVEQDEVDVQGPEPLRDLLELALAHEVAAVRRVADLDDRVHELVARAPEQRLDLARVAGQRDEEDLHSGPREAVGWR